MTIQHPGQPGQPPVTGYAAPGPQQPYPAPQGVAPQGPAYAQPGPQMPPQGYAHPGPHPGPQGTALAPQGFQHNGPGPQGAPGIRPPRAPMMGGGMGGGAVAPYGRPGAPGQRPQGAVRRDDLAWVKSGQVGASITQQLNQQAEQRRAESRERGYWPTRFRLRSTPGNTGQDHIGHVIVLDAQPGPRYYEHALRNPRSGFNDLFEPCCHELENCPLCPPNGQNQNYFVMLLTILNLKGYVKRDTGEHIHPTKEILAVKVGQQPTYDRLWQNFGSLRGLQLCLIRQGQRSSAIGDLDPASPIVQHSDADIEAYLRSMNKWRPRMNRENQIEEDEAWMSRPFDYGRFLHRPEAERLRRLYGGLAPVGASGGYGQDQGQWGQQPQGGYDQGGYGQPQGYAQPPAQGGPAFGPQGYAQPGMAMPPQGMLPQGGGYGMPAPPNLGPQDHAPQDHAPQYGDPGTPPDDPGDPVSPEERPAPTEPPAEVQPVRQRAAPPPQDPNLAWANQAAPSGPVPPDLDDDIPF